MTDPDLEQLINQASALSESEMVTRALSRDVVLPHAGSTLVLITLDNGYDHTKPTILGPRGLGNLNAAIDAARERDDVAGIAITGKPFFLAAGADLTAVAKITERSQAKTITQIGHAVFDKLHSAAVPTFAFINGLALGGGLEVALYCDYRTVSGAAAGLALPECFLGMLPGWGGAYLLPNLIGADGAVTVIVENPLSQNKMLKPSQAYELGIADVVFDAADFLERSLDWAGKVVAGTLVVDRREVDRGPAWDAAVARGKAFADQKISGAAPAPYRALELISAARTAERAAAFAAEDEALADLLMSPELRSSLYAFDLVQKRAKRPVGAPDPRLARPLTQVGVVGAGLMASQLAWSFLRRLQVPVVICDLDQQRVQSGLDYVHAQIDKLLATKRMSPDETNRLRALLSGTTDQADFAGCDLVIEAVYEDLSVKQQVFGELEQYVSDTCVLATNTSSLSVTAMASHLAHPERVVGLHFFNPVALMPLLEVVRAERTNEATLATAFKVAKELKKSAVLVKDAAGFVFNRLLIRMMAEVIQAVDEGTPIPVADGALRPLGLPMPPFVLMQLVGPAVTLHVTQTLHDAFGERFPVSPNLAALVRAAKRSVYDWTADGKPYVSAETKALLTVGDRPSTADQVRLRALSAMAEEIALMLSEGVVAAPMDIDLCMILGGGWPFHLGGITPYLDREGISEKVVGHTFLPAGVASVAETPSRVQSASAVG